MTDDLLMCSTAVSLSLIGNVKYTWTSSSYIMELRPWAWMMSYIGALYREKRIGPMTEPWGTPHSSGTEQEELFSILTTWDRPERYDFSQLWTHPPNPCRLADRVSMMSWSIVSNADVKSSNTRSASSRWSRFHGSKVSWFHGFHGTSSCISPTCLGSRPVRV